MTDWILFTLAWIVGLVYFMRPAWVTKRGATPQQLQQTRYYGLLLWGALAVCGVMRLLSLGGVLRIHSSHESVTPTTIWQLLMGGCAILYAVLGLLFFLNPEKFANKIAGVREIRRFGILMWLVVVIYALAYILH